MTVTTLPERKAAEAHRRSIASRLVIELLRDHGAATGGRYIVFGSALTGTMRYDSDFDVILDFPESLTGEAWRYVEEVCAQNSLPPDIHDKATTKPEFVEKALLSGKVVP